MSTRSTSTDLVPPFSDPESFIRNRQRNLGDPSLLLDFEEINMADNNNNNVQGPPPAGPNISALDLRSMEELLQAPTDGVEDAIVVPSILASQFELKIGLLNLVTAISFHGFENYDPQSHIQSKKINENFSEAWDRFKDLLNKCPHHGFSHLYQIDAFYNGLSQSDQDSLNSTTGGNFLTRNTQEALTIIENKSKVLTSRNKPQVSSASGGSSQDAAIIALTKQERPKGVFPSGTVLNPRGAIKAITTRSGIVLAGPSDPPPPLSSSFKELFKKLHFNISLAEALAHIPKYAKMLKDLLADKEKLLGLENTSLTENCLAVFLKKLPEKLRDPGKFPPKSFHPFGGSTTSPSDSFPNLTSSETSDSSLEEFADELALLDQFPQGNEDASFDPEADLREIEYLLNRDPSTDSSPETVIDIIDPVLESFIDEPALVYSFPPEDDDDDLFDFKSDNEK
nr:reverse transcriptase domain-containing protein [Tanacetum cinerariifolium]